MESAQMVWSWQSRLVGVGNVSSVLVMVVVVMTTPLGEGSPTVVVTKTGRLDVLVVLGQGGFENVGHGVHYTKVSWLSWVDLMYIVQEWQI
jgi:hypothetical protein